MTELEKRLENTQTALVGLYAFLMDLVPEEEKHGLCELIGDYMEANTSLGSKNNIDFIFSELHDRGDT